MLRGQLTCIKFWQFQFQKYSLITKFQFVSFSYYFKVVGNRYLQNGHPTVYE